MANPGVEVSQIQTPSLSRPLGGQAASSARRIRHWADDGTDDRQRCGFSADRAGPSAQRVAMVAILLPGASGDAATRSRSRAPSALKSEEPSNSLKLNEHATSAAGCPTIWSGWRSQKHVFGSDCVRTPATSMPESKGRPSSRNTCPMCFASLCSSRALPELHDATDIRASWARRSLGGYSRPGYAPSARRSGGSGARGACAADGEQGNRPPLAMIPLARRMMPTPTSSGPSCLVCG